MLTRKRHHTYQFRQLPPLTFLCRLLGTPTKNAVGVFDLTPADDAKLFKELNSAVACFDAPVNFSRSRKKAEELDVEAKDTILMIPLAELTVAVDYRVLRTNSPR
ncbi:hypothetical protein DFH08DRAFT_948255 [Mycena albidolilacea]|uniref:Uncharacterized protein n=1 Tax=Mycena albidolilacea TaxID=1033008 RepID=A0AAD7AQP1_9AGAR|nr:hypothetical protein DFH08DRAFT_948255 [Mycena albidolilacea]